MCPRSIDPFVTYYINGSLLLGHIVTQYRSAVCARSSDPFVTYYNNGSLLLGHTVYRWFEWMI